MALKLNVDFSDAGYLPGAAGIPFGDLFLGNFIDMPQLNGMTVRQVLSEANTLLGGGASAFAAAPFNLVLLRLSIAFLDMSPDLSEPEITLWAQEHLRIGEAPPPPPDVPEPPAGVLSMLSLLGVGWHYRRAWSLARPSRPSGGP